MRKKGLQMLRRDYLHGFLNRTDGKFLIHSDLKGQNFIMSQENKFVTMMHANDLKCDKTSTTMMCNKVLARNIDVDKLEEDYNYMFYASSRNETIKNTLILSNDFADMYYNVKLLIDVYKNYANNERLPENPGLDVTFAGSKYNTFLSLTMFYNYGTGGFLNSRQGLETVLNIIRDKYFRLEGNQDFEQ